jgi:hypothetical protein
MISYINKSGRVNGFFLCGVNIWILDFRIPTEIVTNIVLISPDVLYNIYSLHICKGRAQSAGVGDARAVRLSGSIKIFSIHFTRAATIQGLYLVAYPFC